MSSEKLLQVVVIDDIRRFALYVWRYLSHCVGFGTGDVSNEEVEKSCPFWDRKPASLATPARDAQVWWINSAGRGKRGEITWKDQIRTVLREVQSAESRRVLVDVRWPGGEDDLIEVLRYLHRHGIRISNDSTNEVLLVSSYYTAPHAFGKILLPVYPKSPETLELLCKELPRPRKQRPSSLHVLVTGAGFEFEDNNHAFLKLGTRRTAAVLEQALSSCGLLHQKKDPSDKFVCPQKYLDTDEAAALWDAAHDGDLDAYWDELLRLELEALRGKAQPGGRKRPDKVAPSRREHELREAFRRQFLADDWGFLNQALNACQIPGLIAWLTTNYTRLADRAIDFQAAHAGHAGQKGGTAPWRIVSTSSEAERLLQELLHLQRREQAEKTDNDHRFLFKLHGDLAHLLTMAIAGHDKEIFSPLSLPISSLHPIYTSAEQYLERRLRAKDNVDVFWHVVGHGLKDALLVQLIRDVHRMTTPGRHGFILVDPFPEDPSEVLRQNLEIGEKNLQILPMYADQYLARLRLVGVPKKVPNLPSWRKRILPAAP